MESISYTKTCLWQAFVKQLGTRHRILELNRSYPCPLESENEIEFMFTYSPSMIHKCLQKEDTHIWFIGFYLPGSQKAMKKLLCVRYTWTRWGTAEALPTPLWSLCNSEEKRQDKGQVRLNTCPPTWILGWIKSRFPATLNSTNTNSDCISARFYLYI